VEESPALGDLRRKGEGREGGISNGTVGQHFQVFARWSKRCPRYYISPLGDGLGGEIKKATQLHAEGKKEEPRDIFTGLPCSFD